MFYPTKIIPASHGFHITLNINNVDILTSDWFSCIRLQEFCYRGNRSPYSHERKKAIGTKQCITNETKSWGKIYTNLTIIANYQIFSFLLIFIYFLFFGSSAREIFDFLFIFVINLYSVMYFSMYVFVSFLFCLLLLFLLHIFLVTPHFAF